MPRKVLIVTGEFDTTADAMVLHLKQRGANFERFHPKDFPAHSKMDLRLANDCRRAGGVSGWGVDFDWSDVGSVWYRRPEPHAVLAGLSAEEKEFAIAESGSALYGAWRILDALWVNHPDRNRIAESKALQLATAQRLGFIIPNTLFTNDPARLARFYDETGGRLIYKAMTQTILGQESRSFVYTSRVTREHLTQAHLLANGPGLFQQQIAKACDLRITVIGDRVFPLEIHASAEDRANLDWRRLDVEKLKHRPHGLPKDIEKLCLQMTSELGLQYGAIDMVLTPDSEYVFLEINPSGQYGWIEDLTDMPLTEALAELLIAGAAQPG